MRYVKIFFCEKETTIGIAGIQKEPKIKSERRKIHTQTLHNYFHIDYSRFGCSHNNTLFSCQKLEHNKVHKTNIFGTKCKTKGYQTLNNVQNILHPIKK